VAVAVALVTGRPENYFLPRVVTNAAVGLVLVVTILVGRPAIGLIAGLIYRFPQEWLAQPEVRRVFALATWPWVGLCALRAGVYLLLIDAHQVGWLAAVSTVLGWPAFAALLIATYAFVRRRVTALQRPAT
jgi:Protein of unknown function (DUF3159)